MLPGPICYKLKVSFLNVKTKSKVWEKSYLLCFWLIGLFVNDLWTALFVIREGCKKEKTNALDPEFISIWDNAVSIICQNISSKDHTWDDLRSKFLRSKLRRFVDGLSLICLLSALLHLHSPAPRRRELDYLSGSRTPLLRFCLNLNPLLRFFI